MKAAELLKEMHNGNRPAGFSEKYEMKFVFGPQRIPCTRAVKTLRKRGLVDLMTLRGGEIAVNLTEEGRGK